MKKRLSHIWYYYKIHILIVLAVLIILANFISQKRQMGKPDYYVSIVTDVSVSPESRDALQRTLETLWPDRDGNGRVQVEVNHYPYNGKPDDTEDPSAFMAAAVQLAADLQQRISLCFLTDRPEILDPEGMLCNMGTTEEGMLGSLTELNGFWLLCYDEGAALVGEIQKK